MGVKCDLGASSKWVGSAGVPTCIVRNFGMQKSRLRYPTRWDQYSIGPREVHLIAIAITTHGTATIAVIATASTTSTIRFKVLSRYRSPDPFIDRRRWDPGQWQRLDRFVHRNARYRRSRAGDDLASNGVVVACTFRRVRGEAMGTGALLTTTNNASPDRRSRLRSQSLQSRRDSARCRHGERDAVEG